MATATHHSIIWALVRAQHGVISWTQLLALGLTPSGVKHRVRIGRLHRVYRGVYAVGRPDLTRCGRWMAAVLACGPTAFLSHFSAAALWGLAGERGAIELSVSEGDRRSKSGLIVHRRKGLTPTTRHNIPVTSVVDTLIDIAPSLSRRELEAAIRQADVLGHIDPERLRARLDATQARPGVAILRATLDRRTFRLTDSELERYYLPCSDRAGLPTPLTQQYVNGFRVDFFYPGLGLVVETDGLRYHRTPAQQAKDLVRAQRHHASGLTPLRFTHEQIRYEPAYVVGHAQGGRGPAGVPSRAVTIQRERIDGVEVLRLDRPAQRNAFDSAMLAEVNDALDELASDETLRVLVFSTTSPDALSAGADVAEELDAHEGVARMEAFARMYAGVVGFPLPTVCVCVGHCVGAGAELAAGCDLRIAGDNMKARWVGVRHGVPVGPARLAPLVGEAIAKDLIFTSRMLGAEEAEEVGFVREVHPAAEAEAKAIELAQELATRPPAGLRELKRLFLEFSGTPDRVQQENRALVEFQRSGAGLPRR